MATDKDSLDPHLRWKTRYYDTLGELETKEKAWREAERLLRHLISRLTLAADGRHPPLSKSLADLRNAVRDGKDVTALRTLIETISVQIGELDQIRSNRQALKSPARILQVLLKQLSFSEDLARQVKDLDKQLGGLEEYAEVQPVIDQVAALLKQNMAAVPHAAVSEAQSAAEDPRESRRTKLLERIFARHPKPDTAPLPTANDNDAAAAAESVGKDKNTESDPLLVTSSKTIAPAVGDLLLQLALRLPDPVKRRINFRTLKSHINKARRRKDLIPIVEVIAQQVEASYESQSVAPIAIDNDSLKVIADAVKAFVQHVQVPVDLRARLAEVEKMLEELSEQADGLVHCLNLLAEMVAEICRRLGVQRNELEGFFVQLSLRLQELDSNLQKAGQLYESGQQRVTSLEGDMRSEIGEIRNSLQNLSELQQLKQIISVRLDAIDARIKQFHDGEQQRYQEAQGLISELNTKVRALEQDGAQLRQRLEQTHQETLQDVLTGLPNRRAYEERIANELARCRRYQTALTMVVWDVDNFKSINDTYGHAAGDRVLKVIGTSLHDTIRATDFIARYGGEEFVLLLPETELELARSVADKLRALIENTPFHFQSQRVVITVSGGLAQYREDEAVSTFFERADQALYQAKQNGRNRIETAG